MAAATLGAGHRLGVCRGLPFDVKSLEGVAAVIAFEFGCASEHSIFVGKSKIIIDNRQVHNGSFNIRWEY